MIQSDYGRRVCTPPVKTREMKSSGPREAHPAPAARTGGAAAPEGTDTLSQAEELQVFKEEFYKDLSKIPNHPSVGNVAVQISDEAFQAMKDDPEYREQVLSLLKRDFGASVAPRTCSLLITVGKSLQEYRGDSWPACTGSEFQLRAKGSFYRRSSETQRKPLSDDYREKKLYVRQRKQLMLEKARQDRRRLAQIGAQLTSYSSIEDLMKTRLGTASPLSEIPLPSKTDAPFSDL